MLKELITEEVTMGDVNFVRTLFYGVFAILVFMALYYFFKWARTYETEYKVKAFFFAVICLVGGFVANPTMRRDNYIANVLQDVKSDRVAKYYDMRKDGDFLRLDRKGEDVPDLLKVHVKAKIIKESSGSYQLKYKGKVFKVEKQGANNE